MCDAMWLLSECVLFFMLKQWNKYWIFIDNCGLVKLQVNFAFYSQLEIVYTMDTRNLFNTNNMHCIGRRYGNILRGYNKGMKLSKTSRHTSTSCWLFMHFICSCLMLTIWWSILNGIFNKLLTKYTNIYAGL